jgi:hypothetical protein
MNLVKHVLVLATGAAFGVGMMLSCGDNPPRSDAATCDCPASEPPLAGRIIYRDDIRTIGPANGASNGDGSAGISCLPGTLFLSGSCTTTSMSSQDVILREAGFVTNASPGWRCVFHNNTLSPIEIKATAVCLQPAP